MKCANATAGIASVVTGLAMALSGASAHATFLYLNQSQLIGAAISASGVASSSGESAATGFDARYDSGNIAPVAEEAAGSDTEPANVAIAYAGMQPAAADGDDTESSHGAGYAAPTAFRWMTPSGLFGADQGWLRYSAAASTVSGSPAATSSAKESRAVSDGAATPAASTPVANSENPPLTTPPNEADASPVYWAPISTSLGVETPIVDLPSKTVPEPSTVGLLGIGLLLVLVGAARGKRAVRR